MSYEQVRRTRLGLWMAMGYLDLPYAEGRRVLGLPVWAWGFTRAQALRRLPGRIEAERRMRERSEDRRRKRDATWEQP